MWEKGLIYVLIYLGVFFILPDKIRRKILSNPLLGMTAVIGLALGLYGVSAQKDGFTNAKGCGPTGTMCEIQDTTKPYCLTNEIALPKADVDQTLIFNILGRYIRVYAPPRGDGIFSLSQVVVNNAAGTNLALNKPTTAVGSVSGCAASSAVVDGTLTPRNWPSVWQNANTLGVANEYWQVDLGSVQLVTKVRVISRGDYGDTLGVAAGQPNRVQNVRVLVLQNTSDTPAPLGICTATPNLDMIYPVGTTAEEQQVIGPLILDGNNVQTALAIYRVLKQGAPSSLTQYGLTDSQSAEAYKAMRTSNLGAQRAAGSINDTTYFAMMDAMKNITSMAAMSFDTAAELRAYMRGNTKVILNPVYDANGLGRVDSAGKLITTSVSDGGVAAATTLIINQTIPKRADDTSNVYSLKTTGNANVNIDVPPNTSTWAATLMSKLPVQQTPMIPSTGRGIVVTPNMSDSDKAAALSSATSSITEPGFTTPAKAVVDSAASNSSNSLGFVSPKATRTIGQSQWFMVTNGATSQAVAASQCAQYGAKLATLAQITDAYNAGASYQAWGWVADSPTSQGFPVRNTSLNQSYSSTTIQNGNGPANCFGPKPPRGTPNVAAWTDTARTIGTEVYTAGDWSKRTGGDGGVSRLSNGTPGKPGTPLATAEVFYLGGNILQSSAQAACSALGADLATLSQLQVAQAGGAQWCAGGWLKDVGTPRWPMQIAVGGCGGPGVNDLGATSVAGTNCYGIKPSQGEANVAPFSTYSDPSTWSQSTYFDTNACPAGSTSTACVLNGVSQRTCLRNGETCARPQCPSGTYMHKDGRCAPN